MFAVGRLVAGVAPKAFVPVTVTVIVHPSSATTSVYVLAVAPPIATPLRFHW
jgi:hypothetical protein